LVGTLAVVPGFFFESTTGGEGALPPYEAFDVSSPYVDETVRPVNMG
jgi:hypothetical protein